METRYGPHHRGGFEDPPGHELVLAVLGIPVTFEANDAAVITAAAAAFAAWRGVEHVPRLVSGTDSARVRIFIEESDEDAEETSPDLSQTTWAWPDRDRLVVRTGAAVGIADAARRDTVLFISREALTDVHGFRADILEPLVLATLAGPSRIPIRAAAVEYADVALLLAGPPRSGKSTLTCAAALAGFRVLSEDIVHVQLEPRLRVWGLPGFLHVPLDAARFFPDIAVAAPRTGFAERERIVFNVRELSAMPALPVAQQAGVCVLVRSDGDPVITPLGPDDLEPLLLRSQVQEAPSEMFAQPVHVLSRHGGWMLETGSDPNRAVELLRETLGELLGL